MRELDGVPDVQPRSNEHLLESCKNKFSFVKSYTIVRDLAPISASTLGKFFLEPLST